MREILGGSSRALFDSPADWISPNPGTAEENYRYNPSPRYVGKVIVNDTDHLWGHTGGDAVWVWKSFCRGLNVLFMEELTPSPTWQDSAREGMGLHIMQYRARMIGAFLSIGPGPQGGTVVSCSVPQFGGES